MKKCSFCPHDEDDADLGVEITMCRCGNDVCTDCCEEQGEVDESSDVIVCELCE